MHEIIFKRNDMGIMCGIPSICTANDLVIEACLQQGKRFGDDVLIEGTSNQVNQFGGYTGMRPADFKKKVYEIADRVSFPKDRIILGGDHLGPLVWNNEPEETAMAKAKDLVREFVLAGYKKIHLDTSMRLGDDSRTEMLSTRTIARRGAALFQVCEEAYQELLKENPNEMRPSYIIGSEVPIPGGSQEQEDQVAVTKVEDLHDTIKTYKEEFDKLGLLDLFDSIVGIVVQPGVEFGDENLVRYNRVETVSLSNAIAEYPGMVLEGHSTDYQAPQQLKEMVEDGVAILKVGPALTFAVREGLFALSFMEKELIPEADRANVPDVIEQVMMENPKNWEVHYKGTDEEKFIKRRYSFSDRWRYYYADERVQKAIEKLFANLDNVHIPLGMLHQYMPNQYIKIRSNTIPFTARELVKDKVVEIIEDYNYATKYNYMISSVFVS
ncbi:MAG: class II D-tagatose-bisphosphate aldolase, non-catalytic subunit [Eubacterium sp.]|nr:class II D-tagatose-bisphosphate aldolase, non-catalytic subunit [Eubacterium sp.]